MRASFFYIGIVICSQQLLQAHNSHGQGLDKRVTIGANNETLASLIQKLKTQTDLSFVFPPEDRAEYSGITFESDNRTVKEVLDLALKGRGLSYNLQDRTIIIYEDSAEKNNADTEEHKSLPERKMTDEFLAIITGTVRDASTQEPLAGVNVIVKNTTKGTTTDAEGKFSIDAEDNDVLVFSFIGFKTFETQVNGRTEIKASLEGDVTALDEVVVNAGYWSVKERENTGNISKVTSDEIQRQPVSNPLAALEGKMAGVFIQQTSGVPGGGINIQIRGLNSLRSDANSPLFIIDGIPFPSNSIVSNEVGGELVNKASPLNNINPSDIESIEILKDAGATAIYGSRGSNGVVLITTKRGKSGGTKVNISFDQGIGKVTRTMDLLNTQQWLEMRHEAFQNDGVAMTMANAPDLLRWDTTRYTNWQKVLIGGTAKITNANVSISSGDERTQFLFGTSYRKEGTVFPGDFSLQRMSGHFNINHLSANKKLQFSFSTNYVLSVSDLPRYDFTTDAITLAPNAPKPYDDSGNLNWENSTWNNPYALLGRTYKSKTDNFISGINISYEIIDGLKLKSNFGYTKLSIDENKLTPGSTVNPAQGGLGSNFTGNKSIDTWIVEPQAEYTRQIKDLKISALLGGTLQETVDEGRIISATGYTTDALVENLLAAPSISIAKDEYTQYRYGAFFGRLNFNYGGKYIIELTGRRDGSSRFGPNKQFANFAGISSAWIFSNESFLEGSDVLSFGKLRVSYGTTGSDQIPDYGYLGTYSAMSDPYNGVTGLVPSRLVNPDYSWETNKKFETGIETGFFDDRVSLSASWYRNRSSNQLVGYPLPSTTGRNSVQYNLPATVQNTGFEFVIGTTNLITTDFTWKTNFNITAPRNKLVEYPNLAGSSYANTYVVGESLFIRKKLHSLGVDPETGRYIFEDINGNDSGTDLPADLQGLKKVAQDYYGGLQNTFNYKGFQLEVLFQFVKQTGNNYMASFYTAPGTRFSNQPTLVMNRWQKQGDDSEIQRFSQGGAVSNLYSTAVSYGDGTIGDASFIRLKNASLSWTLTPSIAKKLHLQQARIYVLGQNLLTFSNYVGADPESQSARTLPPLRVVTMGINLTF